MPLNRYEKENGFILNIESVLNSNYNHYGDINKFFEVVKLTGYPYFLWNGIVHMVKPGGVGYVTLDVTIDELRQNDLVYEPDNNNKLQMYAVVMHYLHPTINDDLCIITKSEELAQKWIDKTMKGYVYNGTGVYQIKPLKVYYHRVGEE